MACCYAAEVAAGEWRIRLRGDIDAACEDDLRNLADAYPATESPDDVLVDLSEVTFFGVPGLRLLNTLHRRALSQDRQLILRNVPPMPWRIISIAGPADALPDEPDAPDPAEPPADGAVLTSASQAFD